MHLFSSKFILFGSPRAGRNPALAGWFALIRSCTFPAGVDRYAVQNDDEWIVDALTQSVSPFAVALREARLRRSLTIADVAAKTLLSDKQIVGLENDDLSYFYGAAFANKAAATYAALLEVDPALPGGPPFHDPRDPKSATALRARPPTWNESALIRWFGEDVRCGVWWVIGGFAVTVFLFFVYQLFFR
ncbi:MAG: Helix-turn-helix domain [Pseudomonadota bacterium]